MSTATFAEYSHNDVVACNVTLANNIQLAQSINSGGPTPDSCTKLGGLFSQYVAGECKEPFLAGELLLVAGGHTGVNKIACKAIAACGIPLPPALGFCSGV
jgi:hypothetical protein